MKKNSSHSEETKKKMSIAHIGMKDKHHSQETKKKISEAHRHLSMEAKRKMSEARIKFMTSGKMKIKNTSIELAIEQELVNRHIPYLKQAPVEGIALVDFLLSNKIIIQCDGDYWHSRKINKGKDIAQDTVLFFKGYKIFRFTETEINKSAKKCVDKLFIGGIV